MIWILALGLTTILVSLVVYFCVFMHKLALLHPTSNRKFGKQSDENFEKNDKKRDYRMQEQHHRHQQTGCVSSAETNVKKLSSAAMNTSSYVLRVWWLGLYPHTLPASALAVCFSYGVIYHYHEISSVICGGGHPPNLVPSISATIGDFAFTRQVWNAFISMYAGARLFTGMLFWFVYRNVFERNPRLMKEGILLKARNYMHYLEQLSLVGLTVVTSKENLLFHQIYFAIFWVASICCLCTTTYLTIQASKQSVALQARLANVVKWRKCLLLLHLGSSAVAIFWYFAHETMCGDYYYTYFAIAEWTVVLSNITFHALGEFCDGKEVEICVRFLQRGRDEAIFGHHAITGSHSTATVA